jgi:hypothetical protein
MNRLADPFVLAAASLGAAVLVATVAQWVAA